MRAALLRSYHQPLELIERPVPKLRRPDEVLVRIGGAGVCATDVHAIEELMGPAGVSPPCVLGHENAGWVEQAGDLVVTVTKGDAVILYPPYSCGLCVPCRRGNDMHCERHEFTGLSVDGGFAEYVLVRERSVIKLPAGLSPELVAPHADAGLTAYHAVRKVSELMTPGSTVVMVGMWRRAHRDTAGARARLGRGGRGRHTGGPSGAGARARRRRDDRGRRRLGARGARADRRPRSGRRARLRRNGRHPRRLEMLAPAGTYSVIGYGGTVTAPSNALVGQEQSVVANLVGRWTDLWELIQLHAAGRLRLVVQTHPLEAVNDVLNALRAGSIRGRAVLVP